jgi:hypothetical protein
VLQVGEAAVAGAEVVEREAAAQLRQLLGQPAGLVDVARGGRLGDLEDEVARVGAGLREARLHEVRQPGGADALAGEVDLHAALARDPRRAGDHPAVDRGGKVEALSGRQELARHDQLAVLAEHSHEQLLLHHRSAGQLDDRLAVQHEAVVLDRVPDPERPLDLRAQRVLALLALGDVGGDAADAVDRAVLVAQRELLDQVGARPPVHVDLVLELDAPPALEHIAVARDEGAGLLGGPELLVAAADDGAAVRRAEHLVLPVREQVAVLAVLGPDEERRVVDDRLQLSVLGPHGRLGLLALGDVEQNALEAELAVLVLDHGRLVPHPDPAAVAPAQAILGAQLAAGPRAVVLVLEHVDAVIGVQGVPPQVASSKPLLGGVAEQGLDLGADVVPGGVRAQAGGVDDGGHLLHERAQLGLASGESALGGGRDMRDRGGVPATVLEAQPPGHPAPAAAAGTHATVEVDRGHPGLARVTEGAHGGAALLRMQQVDEAAPGQLLRQPAEQALPGAGQEDEAQVGVGAREEHRAELGQPLRLGRRRRVRAELFRGDRSHWPAYRQAQAAALNLSALFPRAQEALP